MHIQEEHAALVCIQISKGKASNMRLSIIIFHSTALPFDRFHIILYIMQAKIKWSIIIFHYTGFTFDGFLIIVYQKSSLADS